MWFTEYTANQIGMITPSGTITEYPTPAGSGPDGIASSNGYLWFTEYNNSASPQVAQIIPAAR